jgi:acetyl esterase/lipase
MAGLLARRLNAVVVAPNYRLAPEEPFPAALDDCVNTVKWVLAQANHLGVDATRIAIAIASAGGGLAAACTQRCGDEGIKICTQAMLYPMLDDRTALQQPASNAVAWSSTSNSFAWTAYLGRSPEYGYAPPYSAPSRREDLTDSPPTRLAVGDLDILCPSASLFAHKLRDAQIPCELLVVPGMYHAADLLVPWANPVREVLPSLIDHLSRHLSTRGSPP